MYSHPPILRPPPLIIADSCEVPLSGASICLAQGIIARLDQSYPNFKGLWRVSINESGGVIEVINAALSGRWGFLMHIAKLDPEGRKVVAAGGELLERYRISRGGTALKVIDELNCAPRNSRGDLVPDCG